MSRLLILIPIALFFALAGFFIVGLQRDPSSHQSALIDKPLPEFSLPAPEGYDDGFSHADLEGQVALINVFASWCTPCAIEHPQLIRIAQAEDDLLLGGLNWKEKPGDGPAWLARLGDPYDFVGDDAKGRVAIDFGVTGAPETFFVDKQGRIRHRHIGPITPDIWERDLKPIVRELQAEAQG